MSAILKQLGVSLPIIQAPMAGVSTPALASAVSNAGGLGFLGVGATTSANADKMIRETQSLTTNAFGVNVFTHRKAKYLPDEEKRLREFMTPFFKRFGEEPPAGLREIYQSFNDDNSMLDVLMATRPAVVSFHFGLPSSTAVRALRDLGIILMATATNVDELRLVEAAGMDAVVAQGFEAGGHRGAFHYGRKDPHIGTMPLVRLFTQLGNLPVVAAGGIMDGAGILAGLRLGAFAAQLGTAFVGCPESSADEGYRKALFSFQAKETTFTSMISGRPARVLSNDFSILDDQFPVKDLPDYPYTYDMGKALHKVASANGHHGYGAHWAGQGAPLARAMPASELIKSLQTEMTEASS